MLIEPHRRTDSQGRAGAVGHHRQRLDGGEDVSWEGCSLQTLEHQAGFLQSDKQNTTSQRAPSQFDFNMQS